MKRILSLGITALLIGLILTKSISAIVLKSKPQLNKQSLQTPILNIKIKKEILNEIKTTKDKILIVDKVIGDRSVKYWEHVIDNIFVINDSMLLHIDLEYRRVLHYKRSWSNIEVITLRFGDGKFEGEYYWKRKVVFPDEDDCGIFYTFNDKQEYPLFCWEVRYVDGNTLFYDLNETPIGYGVTAPSERGFVLQGYGDLKWRYWRENAQDWYNRWFDAINSIKCPSINQISYFIKNETTNTKAFYVIAHSGGESSRFLADQNTYYTANQLHYDMENRSPMKLAFLCCCEAMNNTGPETLSYEFRKGELNGTVTIGYVGMGHCPDWIQSLYWQDYLFQKIDEGYTIKKAFDRACAQYPIIADYVRFIGDFNLKIKDDISRVSNYSNNYNIKLNFQSCLAFQKIALIIALIASISRFVAINSESSSFEKNIIAISSCGIIVTKSNAPTYPPL